MELDAARRGPFDPRTGRSRLGPAAALRLHCVARRRASAHINLHLRAPRRFRFKRMGRQAAARAEASSRDSSSPPRNARARRSRRGCSWNACSMRTRGAHRRLRRSKFAGTRRDHANPARRPRRGYAADNTPNPSSARRAGDEARRFSVVHGGRKILLDHILASPALAAACSSVVILNEGLQDEVTAQEPILGSLTRR